jgi:alanine-glyoxylate transaminase / serine-glyoxylate transaminase / serine-pyruvate transaminase
MATTPTPLLMIPGPVELSPGVLAAASVPPPGHTSPRLIEAFGRSIERMREVWRSGPSGQPFILAGSGTLAMEVAAANLMQALDKALVLNTGYFSERMTAILDRLGVDVTEVTAPVGEAPATGEIREALARDRFKALFATHVDTSTGVRVDPEPLCRLAREAGVLSVFDGVCATAGERFDMAEWGADVYFTASQKAIGLPPGLALMVVSERALAAREDLILEPLLYLDWESWLPIHRAYEERKPSYFATPATSLVMALETGLGEILENGIEARLEMQARAAAAMRAAWKSLGLRSVPKSEEVTGNTLSVLLFPDGIDASLLPRIAARGVTVAGGLHPAVKATSFRLGHMGYTATRPDYLRKAVEAVAGALQESGARVDPAAAVAALENGLAVPA